MPGGKANLSRFPYKAASRDPLLLTQRCISAPPAAATKHEAPSRAAATSISVRDAERVKTQSHHPPTDTHVLLPHVLLATFISSFFFVLEFFFSLSFSSSQRLLSALIHILSFKSLPSSSSPFVQTNLTFRAHPYNLRTLSVRPHRLHTECLHVFRLSATGSLGSINIACAPRTSPDRTPPSVRHSENPIRWRQQLPRENAHILPRRPH